jgi:hypothetical protein
MSNGRLEIIAFMEGANGKKFPKRLGSAIRTEKGLNCYFDVTPVGWNGQCLIQPPRERDDRQGSGYGGGYGSQRDEFDDEVPF